MTGAGHGSLIFKKLNNLFLFYHSLQGDKKERIDKRIPLSVKFYSVGEFFQKQ